MYRFADELLRPSTLLTLAAVLGAIYVRRRGSRRAWWFLTAALAALFLTSTHAISYLALASLERLAAPLDRPPEDADAIVVLAGGVLPRTVNQPRALLGEDSLYRCLSAAELYRRGGRRLVVVSGGTVHSDQDTPAAALMMSDFLIQLGAAPVDLVIEDRSRTTYENARECHELLAGRGLRRIVLVTSASHMPRAVACFRGQGLDVAAAPCHFVTGKFTWRLSSFLPSAGAARQSDRAAHEWLGLLWYWLRGRI